MNPKHSLVGKAVKIQWREKKPNEWQNFKILSVEDVFFEVQGISAEGFEYMGGPIWIPVRDVYFMEEIEP